MPARLEVLPLLLAELGRGLVGVDPLAHDPVPVALRAQLGEHGDHPDLHPPAHQLLGGDALAPHQVEVLRARVGGRTR